MEPVKQVIKERLSNKTKEELLDIIANFCQILAGLTCVNQMAYSNSQKVTSNMKDLMNTIKCNNYGTDSR